MKSQRYNCSFEPKDACHFEPKARNLGFPFPPVLRGRGEAVEASVSRANSWSKPVLFAPYPILSPYQGERGRLC